MSSPTHGGIFRTSGATLGRYLDLSWEADCYLEDDGTATCHAGQYFMSED